MSTKFGMYASYEVVVYSSVADPNDFNPDPTFKKPDQDPDLPPTLYFDL
jgi:hypothetical protein